MLSSVCQDVEELVLMDWFVYLIHTFLKTCVTNEFNFRQFGSQLKKETTMVKSLDHLISGQVLESLWIPLTMTTNTIILILWL